MTRIRSLVLGAVATLTLSACGSDETTGGTGGSGTATGGNATATGGTTSTGGSATATGGTTSTGGSATAGNGGASSTGGSAAATGGSAATSNCQAACGKLKAANCGDLTQTNCVTACTGGTACVSEADAYYGCVSSTGTVSCSTMTSRVAGCDTTGRALNVCSICLPDPTTDDACDTCSEGSCCMQLQAYAAAADLQGFIDCASPASCDAACFDGCVTTNPIAGKSYKDLISCERKSCTSSCVCVAVDTDSVCTTCLKSMCCDLVGPYVGASDFDAFSTCLDPCADQACVDDCAAKYPIAGAAYETLGTQCVDTTCASDCAGP